MLPYMQFCAATPLQEAMCTSLVEAERPFEGSPSYYDWLRRQYAAKRGKLERALAAAGIASLQGEGGFFIIADVSGIHVRVFTHSFTVFILFYFYVIFFVFWFCYFCVTLFFCSLGFVLFCFVFILVAGVVLLFPCFFRNLVVACR